MHKWYLILALSFLYCKGISQNYFPENPVTAAVASNGGLYRLECTTYDSSLQTTVNFFSPWVSENILISSIAFGKVGITYWSSPVDQELVVSFSQHDISYNNLTDEITLMTHVGTSGKYRLVIVDAAGKTIFSESLQVVSGLQYHKINLQNPSAGIYHAKLENEKALYMKKMLIFQGSSRRGFRIYFTEASI